MTSIVSMISTIGVVLLLLIRANATKKMIIHLGALVSQEGELNLSGYIPSMNLALETIKNDTSLPFDFHVTLNDSMVSARACICIATYIYVGTGYYSYRMPRTFARSLA